MSGNTLSDRAEMALMESIEQLGPADCTCENLDETRARLQILVREIQAYRHELESQNAELRHLQTNLEQSRREYANLFEFAPVAYTTLDERGIIRDINRLGSQYLGRDRARLAGMPLIAFIGANHRTAFQGHLSRCGTAPEGVTTELRLEPGEGQDRWVKVYSQSTRDIDGKPIIRTAISDIGLRVEAEERLRDAHRQLEQRVEERTSQLQVANLALQAEIRQRKGLEEELRSRMTEMAEDDRLKDQFIAMLSHELRNPLAAIANAGAILKRKARGDEIANWVGTVIRNQCDHLKYLLDDLLDVARITRNKVVLAKERCELSEIVQAAVELTHAYFDERGHRLEVHLPKDPVFVEVDRVRFAQILGNLLHNAAKFTGSGGRISLDVEVEHDEIQIHVRDTGAGIPEELLARIFEPFVQNDQSLARSQGGLGIGLALVNSLVDLHGGTVEVHSEGIGKGAEFTVHLPAHPSV